MQINIFEVVKELNKELNTLQVVKDMVEEWAGEAHEEHAYPTLAKICRIFDISVGWYYDK